MLMLLMAAFLTTTVSQDPLLVQTSTGWIGGTSETSSSGEPVTAFLGIPFAEPPLGPLRFRHPQPVQPWSDVFNATQLPNCCIQRLLKVSYHIPVLKKQVPLTPLSEDCLKLNIWVPHPKPTNAPVIVFLHGGGFSFGGSTTPITLGDSLASSNDVIVVTLNYRLASLGFLYMDDPGAPGNMGLYDQRMALEWVHKNVHLFGGDPDNLTLFGQSAGAESALFHLLSRKSDNIINRVILSSAPRVSFGILDREVSLEKAAKLADFAGCPSQGMNTSDVIDCLRNLTAEDVNVNEPGEAYNNLVFLPVVDNDIVPADWMEKLSKLDFKAVDVLLGSNKDEGSMFLMLGAPHIYQPTRDIVKPTLEDYRDLLQIFALKSQLLISAVEFQYTNWLDLKDSDHIKRASEKTINDVIFACPVTTFALLFAKRSKVYKYYFPHGAAGSLAPKWFGAFHGADLFYSFGDVFATRPVLPKSELDFSARVMRYMANFARTGDPNARSDGSQEEIPWPRFTVPEETYLVLSPNSTSVGQRHRINHCAFWDEFVPLLVKQTRLDRDIKILGL